MSDPLESTGPPPAPRTSFASDNSAGVSAGVMEALVAANSGTVLAYGDDHLTSRAYEAFNQLFGRPVETLFCWGGTGANVVGLASMLQPWQAVVTPETAHIVADECGAPTRFTGASTLAVSSVDGKLHPDSVEPYLSWLGVEHHPQPHVLSISQATELGTVYSPDEISGLAELAHANGMLVHLDGARIANAVVASGVDIRSLVGETGVDVLTFGLTKNGAMYGEAVIYLRSELAERAAFVRKQAGQLASKSRFIAAQVVALLEDDLWLDNARHANEMAALLADRVRDLPGLSLVDEPQVNSLFVRIPQSAVRELQDWSFFWEWDAAQSVVRWMTSFMTTRHEVDQFARGVAHVLASHR